MSIKISDNIMLKNDNEEVKINNNIGNYVLNNNDSIFILQDETILENFKLILANTRTNFFIINCNGSENKLKNILKPFLCNLDKIFFIKGITKEDIKNICNLNYNSIVFNKIKDYTIEFLSSI